MYVLFEEWENSLEVDKYHSSKLTTAGGLIGGTVKRKAQTWAADIAIVITITITVNISGGAFLSFR